MARPKQAHTGPRMNAKKELDELSTTNYRTTGASLTIEEINADRLTQIAHQNWSTQATHKKKAPAFQLKIVQDIYNSELGGSKAEPPKLRRIMLLEISQYLENYLLPNFNAETATYEHVMSIIMMVNEKFRENVPAWEGFADRKELFAPLMDRVTHLKEERTLKTHEQVSYLLFAINVFQSLENEMVRSVVLKLVSLPLWYSLSEGRRTVELHAHPQLQKHWRHLGRKERKAEGAPGHVPAPRRPEATFLPALLDEFTGLLEGVVAAPPAENGAANGSSEGEVGKQALLYCERFVELMVDLLSQLPTRRFVHTLLEDQAILIKCRMSELFRHPKGVLFQQLVDLFAFYMWFPINDHTGTPLHQEEVAALHYDKVQQLQRLFFKHHEKLRDLALANCGTVEKRAELRKHLLELSDQELAFLVIKQLRLVSADDVWANNKDFLLEVMLTTYERRKFQTEVINEMPLYPTESVLWDENQVPNVHYTGESALALPKLNLQFLTFHDYLLRNFNLFRLEATYEIREDINDILQRTTPYYDDNDKIRWKGWARMAIPIDTFQIIEVRKPNVGENKPAGVTADILINPGGMRGEVRGEWDETKQHDVLFLLSLRPPDAATLSMMEVEGGGASVMEKSGLVYVRGCEVIEVKDEEGKLMNDFTGRVKREEWAPPQGFLRTLTVALDTAQYQLDMNHMAQQQAEDVYGTFNLLMRRKPKENNFKAVLESIRDLMNEDTVVPDWLHDIFLGYGDPAAAQYQNMDGLLRTLDFKDTFLDAKHVEESFPGYTVKFENHTESPVPVRPFRITFPEETRPAGDQTQKGSKRKEPSSDAADASQASTADAATPAADAATAAAGNRVLVVESYVPPNPGPYPQDAPPQNAVRFTPVQVEAIKAGTQPGLTMVVGPPGTGKTDTAVQIMHVLYHNCPGQRTLLITHSNQALNDLFEKILQRDVPARYLLRLGMGEQELATDMDFSRVGRVNAMLARRLELLAEVERLAKQLGVAEDMAYTCETAAHFWLLHVLSRWEKYVSQCTRLRTSEAVANLFPFKEYFADAPQPLFGGQAYERDMEVARGCFRHLKTMFQELEECRAFELLKGQADRVNYLMTKQAKIVAMTCTHAALKRREFLQQAFKYDNLLMEESAQILEIETFIPMLLQKQEDGHSRLKRVIMIGDHHQLPPVVKNMAFQKYSHLDQSLFTRFIRLGTPYIELNAQGRARPSLAKLYNWRYRELGDLPAVSHQPRFKAGNPGFAYDYQFLDVPDYQGKGEHCPVPYFYQNLGEAEYVASVYMYMRLKGYPANQISILTTYNGQKALIRDVIEQKCAQHPAFGRPHKVTTVDKYQGQQNEYILLSLVRTRAVGHLRDVRRLVVAMSRARLGLYVFGRLDLFANCYELQPTFRHFLERPTQLALLPMETYDHLRAPHPRPVHVVGTPALLPDLATLAHMVHNMTLTWQGGQLAFAVHQQQQQQGEQQPEQGPVVTEVAAEEDAAEAMAVDGAEAAAET